MTFAVSDPTGLVYRLGRTVVSCRASTLLPARIDRIWPLVADPSAWDPRVLSIRSMDGGEIREGSQYEVSVKILPWGATSRSVEELVAFEPPRRRTVRGTQLWGTLFIVDTTLKEQADETLCTFISETRLYGPLRVLAPAAAWIGQRALEDETRRLRGHVAKGLSGDS